MASLWSYAIAGYAITALALALYVAGLLRRGRRAVARAEEIAAARREGPPGP
jgi:hypothetical protein